MLEVWKDIDEFKGLYQISNFGRVKSFLKAKGKILTPKTSSDGYLFYALYKDGKGHNRYAHRLVACAFIPNPDNLREVNHKDENKKNNYVENLEWCTHEYNITYGTLQERSVKSRLANPNHTNAILMYNIDGTLVKRFNSQKQIKEELGIDHSVISQCCSGRSSSSKGFIWIYEKDINTLPERIARCSNNKYTMVQLKLKNHSRKRCSVKA